MVKAESELGALGPKDWLRALMGWQCLGGDGGLTGETKDCGNLLYIGKII